MFSQGRWSGQAACRDRNHSHQSSRRMMAWCIFTTGRVFLMASVYPICQRLGLERLFHKKTACIVVLSGVEELDNEINKARENVRYKATKRKAQRPAFVVTWRCACSFYRLAAVWFMAFKPWENLYPLFAILFFQNHLILLLYIFWHYVWIVLEEIFQGGKSRWKLLLCHTLQAVLQP